MSVIDISRKEKYSRCVGLEEDYVHQVYEKIGKDLSHAKHPLETTVKNFLDKLEPGSLVADIGCGDGRYLGNNDRVFSLGADSSSLQASLARQKFQEALLGDNLSLPFRGNAFDAVLSVGVIHHFTTKERRIKALKELARILRIGGRVLIAVQRHNSQNSQDVLIPWFDVPKDKKPKDSQWLEQDSGEYDLEDDINEDEDEEDSISLPSSDDEDTQWTTFPKQFPPKCYAKNGWNSERHSRSLDYGYQQSSNLVPNRTQLVQTNACYAFVRKALKRFSSVNNADEEPYITPEKYQRTDSAVPSSPLCIQEQSFELPTSTSFNMINIKFEKVGEPSLPWKFPGDGPGFTPKGGPEIYHCDFDPPMTREKREPKPNSTTCYGSTWEPIRSSYGNYQQEHSQQLFLPEIGKLFLSYGVVYEEDIDTNVHAIFMRVMHNPQSERERALGYYIINHMPRDISSDEWIYRFVFYIMCLVELAHHFFLSGREQLFLTTILATSYGMHFMIPGNFPEVFSALRRFALTE